MDGSKLLLFLYVQSGCCTTRSFTAVCAIHSSDKYSQLLSETLAGNCCMETYCCNNRADHSGTCRFRGWVFICLWFAIWNRLLAHAAWLHRYVCWHFSQLNSLL